MSKTIKKCFLSKLTFEKMLDAHYRAIIGKSNKEEILRFNIDLESNIWNIVNNLKNNTYKLGKYRVFTIYEPKERIIKCLPYKDRIVQQWYIYEFIKPYIMPRLISSTCACIDNRGTHYAVRLVQNYLRKARMEYGEYYILKLDIKKYFYSIDKNILYNVMSEYITDKLLLNLTKIFIYDNDDNKGIPIGNYTSQYFANIYLDKLDKYIKYDLGVKYYVRYMDDMVLILGSKYECKYIMNKVKLFIANKLHLELNKKSRYYPRGIAINFCGYRIYECYLLVRERCKKQMRNKIKLWNRQYINNCLNIKRVILSFNSWIAHISHANSYNLIHHYYEKFRFQFK